MEKCNLPKMSVSDLEVRHECPHISDKILMLKHLGEVMGYEDL